MKKITYILAAFAMAAAVSCSSKLDEVGQHGAKDTDSYYANATDDNADALISSVYLSAWDTKGNMDNFSDEIIDNGVYQSTNADTYLSDVDLDFTTLYQINYKCNMIIEKMSDNTAKKKQVIAEAYFFRAWAYFNLIRGWGNPPLVDHVLASNEFEPANGETSALWEYVQSSLDKAIENLPTKSGLGGQKAIGPRVTVEAAEALKGKAYLYAGDNNNAATWFKKVIDSNKYQLLDDFRDLYTVEGDFSDEYLWEWNADDSDDDNRATEYRIYYGDNWRGEYLTQPGSVHLTGYNQGYNENHVTKDFYEFIVKHDDLNLAEGKTANRRMNTVWSMSEAAQMYVTLSGDEYKNSPNYEGDMLAKYTSQGLTPIQAGWALLWTDNYSQAQAKHCAGYLQCKIYMWHSDMYTATGDKDMYSKANWPAMRYSDVLLGYAEAAMGSVDGLAALNTVRKRAGLKELTSYTITDVQDERRAEFFGEGERYFDCRRWNTSSKAFATVGKYDYTTYGNKSDNSTTVTPTEVTGWLGYDSKYDLFPYATTELAQNANLKQNAGW